MLIRRAEECDINGINKLLSEVLEIHAAIRPDIFVSGTTKYTNEQLTEMFKDDSRPVYVAVDDKNNVCGYAFCAIKKQPFSTDMVQFDQIYIDDLCVDSSMRGQHVGKELFDYVKEEAKRLGCYEVTLNVWEGNDSAKRFYEKMGMRVKETKMEYII